ncbi:type I-E CRISPR-associated protein Cas5/CasD [endosymbiont of Lamellibrachia barhami]|uniref:type I-E CRISPR-associated protein Cas5/CasD n=1 Tax=endosymbiont of Lamellibrachia barhami TaxID=205975 RepID=UPI0015B21AC0|nr:type I-E CRISPR-associated protein Cas5/CasD [endosymbiont of Lamellibrachia barhami]
MDALILRFDAPLMSFGGVMVDQHGPTDRFPGLAMLTGLLANALGYRHGDFDRLQALQARIQFAARWDVEPEPIVDYHTVDLGQPKMMGYVNGTQPLGWTTRGSPEGRGKGKATKETHIRYRHYWANGVMTLAVTLEGEGAPNLDELEAALRRPARPLFLGRKTCLPAAPVLLARVQAADVLDALCGYSAHPRIAENDEETLAACWPAGIPGGVHARTVSRYDQREWRNQIHAGRREYNEGRIERPAS